MKLVRYEIEIDAPADEVFRLITEAEGLVQWMAVGAVADAVPGGELRWTHQNGATMIGRFVELRQSQRIVFTYGWADGRLGLSPGSSQVEIDLEEENGRTRLKLVHRGVPPESVADHQHGWEFFLGRLREVVAD